MRTIFCKHYTGLYGHTHCEAGVEYDTVIAGKGTPQVTLPCVIQAYRPSRLPCDCPKCDMPTEAELEAEDRETHRQIEAAKARTAIVTRLGGPWKRGTPGATGRIDCPVCDVKGALSFSRSGYNGHIHAACSTPDCVSWME